MADHRHSFPSAWQKCDPERATSDHTPCDLLGRRGAGEAELAQASEALGGNGTVAHFGVPVNP
jgi:hypothetical protein